MEDHAQGWHGVHSQGRTFTHQMTHSVSSTGQQKPAGAAPAYWRNESETDLSPMPKPAETTPLYWSNGSDLSPAVEMARRLESQLKSFYAVHAPDKIGVAQEVAEHYVGDEDLLNDVLIEKYGHCLPSRAENGQTSKEQKPALITQLKVPTHLKSDRIVSGYASWDTVGEATEAAAAAVARVQTTLCGGGTGRESPIAIKSTEKPGVNPLANTLRSPRTIEEYVKLGNGIPSMESGANADPSGSPHRRTSQAPLVIDSRHLCGTRSSGKSPRTSEMERLGVLGVCDSVHSGRGFLFADFKPVVAASPRARCEKCDKLHTSCARAHRHHATIYKDNVASCRWDFATGTS